jgi:hypothetical protein
MPADTQTAEFLSCLGTAFALSFVQQKSAPIIRDRRGNRRNYGDGERITTMKVLATAATFLGAITLMFVIIVAQRDYQRAWSADAYTQPSTSSATAPSIPERIAQANL